MSKENYRSKEASRYQEVKSRDLKILIGGALVSAFLGANPLALAFLGAAALRGVI